MAMETLLYIKNKGMLPTLIRVRHKPPFHPPKHPRRRNKTDHFSKVLAVKKCEEEAWKRLKNIAFKQDPLMEDPVRLYKRPQVPNANRGGARRAHKNGGRQRRQVLPLLPEEKEDLLCLLQGTSYAASPQELEAFVGSLPNSAIMAYREKRGLLRIVEFGGKRYLGYENINHDGSIGGFVDFRCSFPPGFRQLFMDGASGVYGHVVFLGDVVLLNSKLAGGGVYEDAVVADSRLNKCTAKGAKLEFVYAKRSNFLPGTDAYRCGFWDCVAVSGSVSNGAWKEGKLIGSFGQRHAPQPGGEAPPQRQEEGPGALSRLLAWIGGIFRRKGTGETG